MSHSHPDGSYSPGQSYSSESTDPNWERAEVEAKFAASLTIPREQSRSEEYRYRTLVRLACLLNSESDLDKLLNMVMQETKPLLDADRASLYLVDRDTNQLYSVVALGTGGREIRLPMGRGLAGVVAQTAETINLQDARSDPRFDSTYDRESGYVTRTMLTMPLRNHSGKIIGVIQAINKRFGHFDERDEEVLEAFASISAVSIENATLRHDIERMFDSFVNTMAKTIDARSPQTAGHSGRVAFYAEQVGLEVGLDAEQARVVYLAGLLHDYGKIGVPEAVLTKPGRLDDDEMRFMRDHVVQTKAILSNMYFIGELKRIPLIAGQHHEKVDGSGYPLGLKADEMEIEAKILAVCDVYDAITVKRYYREPMTANDALVYMSTEIGKHFDGSCVEGLKRVVERIGSPRNPDQDTADQFGGMDPGLENRHGLGVGS